MWLVKIAAIQLNFSKMKFPDIAPNAAKRFIIIKKIMGVASGVHLHRHI